MLEIYTQHACYKREEVSAHINYYAKIISELDREKPVGLYADLSYESVIIIIALVNLGYKTAFCSVREPFNILNNFLENLNIDTLICYNKPELKNNIKTHVYDLKYPLDNKINYTEKNQDSFLAYILTSGTTSNPKTAVLSKQAFFNSALSVNNYFNFGSEQTWLLSLPIFHVSGLSIIFRALSARAKLYIARDHEGLVTAIKSGLVSHVSLVPAQVKRLLSENINLDKLSAVVVGGDRLCEADRDRALLRNWSLYETYGMCETASMIAAKSTRDNQTVILPHAQVIWGPEQEILVKATSLFSGYYDQNKINLNLNKNNYFATGDIGNLDLITRKNNRIISGGENIQAEEIEQVLEQHEQIIESVVVGIPDEKMGTRPLAFVKYLEKPLSDQELYKFLTPKLASYKFPVRFVEYPKNTPQNLKKPRQYFNTLMHDF